MSKILVVVGAIAVFFFTQNVQAMNLHEQSKFVGPIVALNLTGSNTFFFGVNFEYMLKRDIGIGGMFRYFTYTSRTFVDGGSYVFTGGVVGAQANYHFKVPQNELDPFVGVAAGLVFSKGGFKNTSTTYGYTAPNQSDIMFAIVAGTRYFFSEKFAGVGRIAFGANYNAVELGVDFSL